ncbi:hypothetical protein [Wolbachia endosymbiont (group B) of Episyrphus balteatus]|uniref:hypothetical protein n=2 Tax=unclassified Wolbachia TaxID=2640676 RepID=UPI002227CBE7|nr:hypothetical protein [Wolbachia endosymbiont (group B) of Episyrphus balteatus]
MEKHIFKIDDKNPLYKKLIKLPTAYYIVKENGNVNTVSSHIGTVEVGNINDLKLKEQGDEIVLFTNNSPLKLNGTDFIIEQKAIIGENQENIIKQLKLGEEALISRKYIKDSNNFVIELIMSDDQGNYLFGMLNFINFNDENDPVLEKIKEEKSGLYFTIEGDYIYISDEEGKCLPVCKDGSCYKYQYTKNEHDILEISEVSTIIKNLTKTEQCSLSEATAKAGQNSILQQEKKLSDDINEEENGKCVATLPKIGYHMLNGELVIYNHTTKEEEMKIPRDFHYLKVVQSSNNDDYQLTFCNFLGNEFFEHKKYDPQYSKIPDEYQYISLNCMKKEYKPNFCKLLNDKPSFFITEGTTNPNSPSYCPANIFELTNSGKGRKMTTLTEQFSSVTDINDESYSTDDSIL